MATHNTLLARFDHAEYRLCRRLNRGVEHTWVRVLFKTASRLGDGIIWYALMLALPLIFGGLGLRVGLIMLATSAVNLATYKFLKRTFVRERPFIRHAAISLALAIAASRVVLGLHYPTDVLVGALLGVITGSIGAALV